MFIDCLVLFNYLNYCRIISNSELNMHQALYIHLPVSTIDIKNFLFIFHLKMIILRSKVILRVKLFEELALIFVNVIQTSSN